MIRTVFFGFLSLCIGVQVACTALKENPTVQVIKVIDIPRDVQIPQAFIQTIESDLQIETKILSPVFNFVPLQVLFVEKSVDVLLNPRMLFEFPKGGGRIDMQEVIRGAGSFYLSFPDEQFKNLPELEHLFYVSQAPEKEILKETFGVGCGKWIDLKNQFTDLKKSDFMLLNSTGQRHLFVLAGHYIFVFRKLNQVFLTQLSISDSRNVNELCPQVKGSFL